MTIIQYLYQEGPYTFGEFCIMVQLVSKTLSDPTLINKQETLCM